jgi:hypothetical protein
LKQNGINTITITITITTMTTTTMTTTTTSTSSSSSSSTTTSTTTTTTTATTTTKTTTTTTTTAGDYRSKLSTVMLRSGYTFSSTESFPSKINKFKLRAYLYLSALKDQ